MTARHVGQAILPVALVAALVALNGRADGEPESDPESEQEQTLFRGMPDADGRLEVFGFCGSCHSIDLVLQQGLSRAVWEEVLVEMVRDQEMVPLKPDIRVKVLDYLEEYYGPDRKARTQNPGGDGIPPSAREYPCRQVGCFDLAVHHPPSSGRRHPGSILAIPAPTLPEEGG